MKFAVYNGEQYSANFDSNHKIRLFEPNEAIAISRGFEVSHIVRGKPVYIKTVSKDELDSLYEIKTFVVYKGEEFEITSVRDEKVILLKYADAYNGRKNKEEVKKYSDLGFEIGYEIYEKEVHISECERFYEVREDIELSKSGSID